MLFFIPSQTAVSKKVNRKLSGRKKCSRKKNALTCKRDNHSMEMAVKEIRQKSFTVCGFQLESTFQKPAHSCVQHMGSQIQPNPDLGKNVPILWNYSKYEFIYCKVNRLFILLKVFVFFRIDLMLDFKLLKKQMLEFHQTQATTTKLNTYLYNLCNKSMVYKWYSPETEIWLNKESAEGLKPL